MRVTSELEHRASTDRHYDDSTEIAWSGKPSRVRSKTLVIDATHMVAARRSCPAFRREFPEEPTVERRQHTGKLGVHSNLNTPRGRRREDYRAEHC